MSSLTSYLECFKWPLIEECRAKIDQSLDKIAGAAFQQIERIEPPRDCMDTMKFDLPTSRGSLQGDRFQNVHLKPTDLILITTCARPKRKQDLLFPHVLHFLAIVTKGNKSEDGETNQPVEVTLWAPSENPATIELSDRRRQWYVAVLDCLATPLRIWDALSVPRMKDGQKIEDVFPVLHEAACAGQAWGSGGAQEDTYEDRNEEWITQSSRRYFEESSNLNEYQCKAVMKVICSLSPPIPTSNSLTGVGLTTSSSNPGLPHQRHIIQLIQGLPGTGKTSTIASLLSVVACSGYRSIVCAPTNVAIAEVALRFLRFFDPQGPPTFSEASSKWDRGGGGNRHTSKIRLGDVVITGNGERMKIGGSDLEKIYVGREILPEGGQKGSSSQFLRKGEKIIDRSQRICNALLPASGWAGSVKEMADLLRTGGITMLVESLMRQESRGEKQTPLTDIRNRVRNHFGSILFSLIRHGTTLTSDLPAMCLSETERSEILKVVELSLALISAMKKRGASGFSNWVNGIINNEVSQNIRFDVGSSPKHDVNSFGSISSLLQHCLSTDPGFDIKGRPPQLTKEIGKWCIKHARVVLCTVSSTGKPDVRGSGPLDLAVIDEAAQLVEAEAILAFRLCGIQKMILVGDPKQLPATVMSEASKNCGYGRSPFERLLDNRYSKVLLGVQYRMHPKISRFQNRKFYEGLVRNGANVIGSPYTTFFNKVPYSFIDVPFGEEDDGSGGRRGTNPGSSLGNRKEIEVIQSLLAILDVGAQRAKSEGVEIGVITPYARQVKDMKQAIKDTKLDVEVKTVDGFQGREKDSIIFSAVRANHHGGIGFVKDKRRLNVAISRGKHATWIVGNAATLQSKDPTWQALIRDAKERGCFFTASPDHKTRMSSFSLQFLRQGPLALQNTSSQPHISSLGLIMGGFNSSSSIDGSLLEAPQEEVVHSSARLSALSSAPSSALVSARSSARPGGGVSPDLERVLQEMVEECKMDSINKARSACIEPIHKVKPPIKASVKVESIVRKVPLAVEIASVSRKAIKIPPSSEGDSSFPMAETVTPPRLTESAKPLKSDLFLECVIKLMRFVSNCL